MAALSAGVEALVSETHRLREQVRLQQEELERQRGELIRSHAELKALQDEHRALRVAHALTENGEDDPQVKRRIRTLIEKVDKTLLLLQD